MSEFNFGLNINDSPGEPFGLGDEVELSRHTFLQEATLTRRIYALPCPSQKGEVVFLQEPLDREKRSYVARVRCANPSCGYETWVSR